MIRNIKKISGVQNINNSFRNEDNENRKVLHCELVKLSNELANSLKADYKKLFIKERIIK